MKRVLLVILFALATASWIGCEDYDTESLHFVNSSSFTVAVTSLSIEWTGFILLPGDDMKLSGIRDVDYEYTPKDQVKTGFASTDRYIVFVNAGSDE